MRERWVVQNMLSIQEFIQVVILNLNSDCSHHLGDGRKSLVLELLYTLNLKLCEMSDYLHLGSKIPEK